MSRARDQWNSAGARAAGMLPARSRGPALLVVAALVAATLGWLVHSGRFTALAGFDRLDDAVLAQLARAVSLSEGSTLKTIQQVNSLRQLSARLIRYLATARGQAGRRLRSPATEQVDRGGDEEADREQAVGGEEGGVQP